MKLAESLIVKYRVVLIFFLNLLLTACSLYLALGLRFDFVSSEIHSEYVTLPFLLLVLFRQATYLYYSLNEGYWRYTSVSDLKNIIKAHSAASICFAASIWVLQLPFPRSVILGELVFSIFLCGGSRLLVRSLSEFLIGREHLKSGFGKQAVILGAGHSGHLLVKLLQNSPHIAYRPAVVLDDLERLIGSNVYGVKVKGTLANLAQTLKSNDELSIVIVAIPSLSQEKLAAIKLICEDHNVAFKKLQSFEDIACLDVNEGLQTASIENLLDKEINIEHEDEIRQTLKGKRILVTGAGGSIGSELARQIAAFAPERLALVDNCEYNLYKIERELSRSSSNVDFYIADICDARRLNALLKEFKPNYVFHAAAYKHVPLMEINCSEAFRNNVLGTRNLYDLSAAAGVEKFIFISSDKAVDPSSVMGCTKKIGELIIQLRSSRTPQSGNQNNMKAAAVRFGNVINSTGSVIPLFKEQIANGGPITVTHPDMDRYFMSIKEAVRLVLIAGTLQSNGQIYVLDMGKKIKIVDLANKMLKLYGRRDIKIIFTGLRPGEKMTEYLTASYESLRPSNMRKIQCLSSSLPAPSKLDYWIDEIDRCSCDISNAELSILIKNFISSIELERGKNPNEELQVANA